jgi:hypothetical protein
MRLSPQGIHTIKECQQLITQLKNRLCGTFTYLLRFIDQGREEHCNLCNWKCHLKTLLMLQSTRDCIHREKWCPMPELTITHLMSTPKSTHGRTYARVSLTQCQSRLYPPVRDVEFGLWKICLCLKHEWRCELWVFVKCTIKSTLFRWHK